MRGRLFLIVVIVLAVLVAGCSSNHGPPVQNHPDPPNPIQMIGRELYFGYDSSARRKPAEYIVWSSTGDVEVFGGDTVARGATYVLPIPKIEGQPRAQIYPAKIQPTGRWLLDEDKPISVYVREDTTYSHSEIAFWKLKTNADINLPAVLSIDWQARDVEGNAFPLRQYYRIEDDSTHTVCQGVEDASSQSVTVLLDGRYLRCLRRR